MAPRIPQLIFLCIIIAAVGHARSNADTTIENALYNLDKCRNPDSSKGQADECYQEIIDLCEDICPTDKCPIEVNNLQKTAVDERNKIWSSARLDPWSEDCLCELEEEYIPLAARYNSSVQDYPNDAVAWNDRGVFFAERCCFDEALRSFDEAIRINPHHAEPWYNKGVLIYEEDPSEALDCFNKSVEINSEFAEAWFNRGTLLLSYEIDLESPTGIEAQLSYDRAFELKPELNEYIPPYLVYKIMASF